LLHFRSLLNCTFAPTCKNSSPFLPSIATLIVYCFVAVFDLNEFSKKEIPMEAKPNSFSAILKSSYRIMAFKNVVVNIEKV
jgi:hypothetical protein